MARKNKNHYIVILCGGTGPRLWPLSRVTHPKQFLNILSNDSLLVQTIKRCQNLVPKENIYLITNSRYSEKIQIHTKNFIKPGNIISEPSKKNTMLAILLACAVIKNKNSQAIVTSIPSDQYIEKIQFFEKDLQLTTAIATNHPLVVTIGYKPDHPNPSYGYILVSQKINNYYPVLNFVEKPKGQELQSILNQNSYWNTGVYTFQLDTLINETARLNPEYFKLYLKLEEYPDNQKVIKKIYSISPSLPIDQVISEKSKNLVMIKARFFWNDIGEWKSIFQNSPKNKDNIAILNKTTQSATISSNNCLLSTDNKDKIIGLVGVSDLAIIDTDDALLICKLEDSFYVRELIGKIVSHKKTEKYFLKSKND